MSAIFKTHTSVPYVSKGKDKTVAPAGNRLVVTIAKKDKDGNYGANLQVTHATAIPELTRDYFDWESTALRDACTQFLLDSQGDLIGERIKVDGTKSHTDADISPAAILAYLTRVRVGDSWDAERIASWFIDVVAPYVGVKLLEVNPTLAAPEKESEVVALLAKNQAVVVDALSKNKNSVGKKNAELARARLALVDPDERDAVWKRFDDKLDAIINPPVVDIGATLGF